MARSETTVGQVLLDRIEAQAVVLAYETGLVAPGDANG